MQIARNIGLCANEWIMGSKIISLKKRAWNHVNYVDCTDFLDSLSLPIRPFHPSLLAVLPDYILCLHRAVVGNFVLVCGH